MKHLFALNYLFLFIGFILISKNVNAQKTEIETTKMEIKDNKLIVNYDFKKIKKNQTFEVWIEISTLSRKQINANTLTGDIGKVVTPGVGKQIIWDYVADGILLNEEINVEVKAILNGNQINSSGLFSNPILLSAIVPGLGISKLEDGKAYWLMGVLTYGSLAGSIFMNNAANTDYESYIAETADAAKSDTFFKDSESKDNMSKIMAYSAGGIWAISMVWTIIKAKKQGKSTSSITNKKRVFFYSSVNPKTKTAGFTLKYRF